MTIFSSHHHFSPSSAGSGGCIYADNQLKLEIQHRTGCWLETTSGRKIFDARASRCGQVLGHLEFHGSDGNPSGDTEEPLHKLTLWLADLTKNQYRLAHITTDFATQQTWISEKCAHMAIKSADCLLNLSPQSFDHERPSMLQEDWAAFGTCGRAFLHQRLKVFPHGFTAPLELSSFQTPLYLTFIHKDVDHHELLGGHLKFAVHNKLTTSHIWQALHFLNVWADEQIPMRAWLTERLLSHWSQHQVSKGHVSNVNILGSSLSFSLPEKTLAHKLASRLLDEGILMTSTDDTVHFAPPVLVSDEDLEQALSVIEGQLDAVTAS